MRSIKGLALVVVALALLVQPTTTPKSDLVVAAASQTIPSTTTTSTVAPTTTTSSTVAPRSTSTEPSRSYDRYSTTTTVPRASVSGGDWSSLLNQYAWPVATARRVMECESGGRANAHNPSGANGLFQILGGPSDPAANVARAYSMWKSRGWEPWTASEHCWG